MPMLKRIRNGAISDWRDPKPKIGLTPTSPYQIKNLCGEGDDYQDTEFQQDLLETSWDGSPYSQTQTKNGTLAIAA